MKAYDKNTGTANRDDTNDSNVGRDKDESKVGLNCCSTSVERMAYWWEEGIDWWAVAVAVALACLKLSSVCGNNLSSVCFQR